MENFIQKVTEQLGSHTADFGLKFVGAILVLIVGIIIAKGIAKGISKASTLKGLDESTTKFIASIIRVALETVVIITACMIIGIPASTFIAILGSAGLAIGLALQGSLTNLAGSLVIMILKPYKVGDYISVNGVEGNVETINVFNTIINTLDNKKITIPNGTASNSVVVNYSCNDLRRVDLNFNVAYGSDIEKVKKVLAETGASHALAVTDPAPAVVINAYNSSSVEFQLRVWCESGNYWPVHNDLLEMVSTAFAKNSIKVPFQQLDVHLDK